MTDQDRKNEEAKNRMQNVMLARFMLSRLFMTAVQVQVHSLDFETGSAIIRFDPSRADAALLAALAGGAR
jgi:hypothetical protein